MAYSIAVDNPAKDLIVVVTLLYGRVAVAVDPALASATCTRSGFGTAVHCNSVWSTAHTRGPLVRVFGSTGSPCSGPYVNNPATCQASSWRAGRYYIGILAVTDASFTVTAYESGQVAVLTDGQASFGSCDQQQPAFYSYRIGGTDVSNASQPPVRFSASAGLQQALNVFICKAADCVPGPTVRDAAFSVAAGSRTDYVMAPRVPGFCTDPLCTYTIGIYPQNPGCLPPACSAFYSVTAQAQVGNSTTVLPYGAIVDRVYGRESDIAADAGATADIYEVMLPAAPASKIKVTVDACMGDVDVFACK